MRRTTRPTVRNLRPRSKLINSNNNNSNRLLAGLVAGPVVPLQQHPRLLVLFSNPNNPSKYHRPRRPLRLPIRILQDHPAINPRLIPRPFTQGCRRLANPTAARKVRFKHPCDPLWKTVMVDRIGIHRIDWTKINGYVGSFIGSSYVIESV